MRHLPPLVLFDRLRELNVKPYYFGLGFIQCKLTPYERMHFYDSRVPNMLPEEEIHDHRYDFSSHVLYGTLRNERYRVLQTPFGSWEASLETCSPVKHASDSPVAVDVELTDIELWHNASYYMRYHEFHRVQATRAITYLHRSDYKQALAHVVRPKNQSKVCPFSAKMSESDCWEIMFDLCSAWRSER